MKPKQQHLFFEGLLRALGNQLNYDLGLEAHKLLWCYLETEAPLLERLLAGDEAAEKAFLADCRLLLLRRHEDRAAFEEVLRQALQRERQLYGRRLQRELESLLPAAERRPERKAEPSKKKKLPEPALPPSSPSPPPPEATTYYQQPEAERSEEIAEIPLRMTVRSVPDPTAAKEALLRRHRRHYIFSNDYLPIPSRQMAKVWRYLEFELPDRDSDEIDITATVKRTARHGFFSDAVYHPRMRNKANSLVLLADRGGSMVPFHALTDELVRTARTDGGHEQARLFYFRNLPVGHLTEPGRSLERLQLALDAFLREIAVDRTAVLLVSDGGAARGRFNARRIHDTWQFLERLRRHAAAVAWLNPMPRERWVGSSAAHIAQRIPMYPVLGAGYLGFDKAVKVLRGQHL